MKRDERPIKSEADYDWALKEIEQYFAREPKAGSAAAKRFDRLASAIDAYERSRWAVD